MDFYNTEELEEWPVGPEEDHMAGLLTLDTSFAERREANEILELFVILGVEQSEARSSTTHRER